MYGQAPLRAQLARELEYVLPLARDRIFRIPQHIYHDELVRNRRHHVRVLSTTKEYQALQTVTSTPGFGRDDWPHWAESEWAREEQRRQKDEQKRVFAELRQNVGPELKGRIPKAALAQFNFIDHLKHALDADGRVIIASLFGSANLLALQNRWSRDKAAYPHLTDLVRGFTYAAYYAAARHDRPIDRNAQADYEQMVYLRHVDVFVSADTKFLKDAFHALWGGSGKVLMLPETFQAFIARL